MAPEEFFSQYLRVSEWWIFSSILHLLPLIICADPDPQRSWIRIQFGVFTTILQLFAYFLLYFVSCRPVWANWLSGRTPRRLLSWCSSPTSRRSPARPARGSAGRECIPTTAGLWICKEICSLFNLCKKISKFGPVPSLLNIEQSFLTFSTPESSS